MSYTGFRITPDILQEAIAATGMDVVRGTYMSEDKNCGCPIGILTAWKLGKDFFDVEDMDDVSHDADGACEILGISDHYHTGFINGFDSGSLSPYLPDRRNIQVGYEDGIACAKAMFGE